MYIILDFDSTIIKYEGLDELAKIALQSHPNHIMILEQIKSITDMGMSGSISFPESLSKRIALLQANIGHLERLKKRIVGFISNSFIENISLIRRNRDNIYVVSGGFEEFILPVTDYLGIDRSHVFANKFLIKDDHIIGADTNRPLSQAQGKVRVVSDLKLLKPVMVIGDGFTDYEIKQAGYANVFGAYIENISRPSVLPYADIIINDIGDIFSLSKM